MVAVLLPAAFLGVFFLYPVAAIVARGLTGEGLDRLVGLPVSYTHLRAHET